MPLPPETRLGPYEILAPIGAGGMGEVYKARDTRLNRFVAIKLLSQGGAGGSERRRRFIQDDGLTIRSDIGGKIPARNHPKPIAPNKILVNTDMKSHCSMTNRASNKLTLFITYNFYLRTVTDFPHQVLPKPHQNC